MLISFHSNARLPDAFHFQLVSIANCFSLLDLLPRALSSLLHLFLYLAFYLLFLLLSILFLHGIPESSSLTSPRPGSKVKFPDYASHAPRIPIAW